MFGWLKLRHQRAASSVRNSTTFLSSDAEAWNAALPGGFAGTVSPDAAMRHAAVYRCVALIAFAAAMLPLKSYEEAADGDRQQTDAPDAAALLRHRPNPRLSRTMFWRQMIGQMLLRGNGIAWIERKNSGVPVALWPVPFDRVAITLNGDRLRYGLILDDGRRITVDQDDVLHFPGSPEWTGLQAKTPIGAMSSAVGLGIEADRFARKYFENDATPSGYITFPTGAKVASTDESKAELRGFWKRTFGGDGRHSGPAILTDGGEYKPIPISAHDAQLLDTRRFQIEDIARIFGVPRFLLGMDETSWGTGIEALGIGFVTYTLDPHLVAIEDEVNFKLFGRGRPKTPGPRGQVFLAEFDRDVLVRGNIENRFKAYQIGLGGNNGPGFLTQNEVRRRQNLPRSSDPGADKLHQYVPRAQGEGTGKNAQADPAPRAE